VNTKSAFLVLLSRVGLQRLLELGGDRIGDLTGLGVLELVLSLSLHGVDGIGLDEGLALSLGISLLISGLGGVGRGSGGGSGMVVVVVVTAVVTVVVVNRSIGTEVNVKLRLDELELGELLRLLDAGVVDVTELAEDVIETTGREELAVEVLLGLDTVELGVTVAGFLFTENANLLDHLRELGNTILDTLTGKLDMELNQRVVIVVLGHILNAIRELLKLLVLASEFLDVTGHSTLTSRLKSQSVKVESASRNTSVVVELRVETDSLVLGELVKATVEVVEILVHVAVCMVKLLRSERSRRRELRQRVTELTHVGLVSLFSLEKRLVHVGHLASIGSGRGLSVSAVHDHGGVDEGRRHGHGRGGHGMGPVDAVGRVHGHGHGCRHGNSRGEGGHAVGRVRSVEVGVVAHRAGAVRSAAMVVGAGVDAGILGREGTGGGIVLTVLRTTGAFTGVEVSDAGATSGVVRGVIVLLVRGSGLGVVAVDITGVIHLSIDEIHLVRSALLGNGLGISEAELVHRALVILDLILDHLILDLLTKGLMLGDIAVDRLIKDNSRLGIVLSGGADLHEGSGGRGGVKRGVGLSLDERHELILSLSLRVKLLRRNRLILDKNGSQVLCLGL
jgi:hypothetical protein